MLVYSYHPDTHEYLGTIKAERDPKDNDRFLIPGNCALVPPKKVKSNEANVYNEEKEEWEVVVDHRGTEVKGEFTSVTIEDLGVKPEDVTIEEPSELEKVCAQYPSADAQMFEVMKWLAADNELNIPAELKAMAKKVIETKERMEQLNATS